MQKVLVFDLYNTLMEITSPAQPLAQLYQLYHAKFSTTYRAFRTLMLTQPLDKVIENAEIDDQTVLNQMRANLDTELASVKPFAETFEVLNALHQQYPLHLISNLASPYKQPLYDLGLDQFFQTIIFSCDVGYVKPQPPIFALVPHLPHDELVMIGDSVHSDIQGAKNMGWKYWQICRTKKEDTANRIISDLRQLLSNV